MTEPTREERAGGPEGPAGRPPASLDLCRCTLGWSQHPTTTATVVLEHDERPGLDPDLSSHEKLWRDS
jgi:hypothetical protein